MTNQGKEKIEVHNVYTLYELKDDGSASEQGLLSFFRPQDWGDSSRWHIINHYSDRPGQSAIAIFNPQLHLIKGKFVMNIIKVPAVFTLKLPDGEWLNLALIRRLQTEVNPPLAVITWDNGKNQSYYGDKAIAIIEAWAEIKGIDKSDVVLPPDEQG